MDPKNNSVTREAKISNNVRLPKFTTILSFIIVGFLVYAFFSKLSMKFYASTLFLFYSLTSRMWVSVVMLGVFQTLIMIPLRAIKVIKQNNIKEFQDKMQEVETEDKMRNTFKSTYQKGNRIALFYSVDFMLQLVSYASIGRLFLTDFYNKALNPDLLFNFVPYPNYPILDIWFKIPYAWFNGTKDLGMHWVWIAWAVIFVAFFAFHIFQSFSKKKKKKGDEAKKTNPKIAGIAKYINANFFFLILIAYFLIRKLPIGWEFRIFSGDISNPYPTFNFLTALVTFLTLMWFGINKNIKKANLARKEKIPQNIIDKTQKQMFKDSLTSATLIGGAAYFITNQIPCAFELSIFTFEVISLSSPLTLDRIILKATPKPKTVIARSEETKQSP